MSLSRTTSSGSLVKTADHTTPQGKDRERNYAKTSDASRMRDLNRHSAQQCSTAMSKSSSNRSSSNLTADAKTKRTLSGTSLAPEQAGTPRSSNDGFGPGVYRQSDHPDEYLFMKDGKK